VTKSCGPSWSNVVPDTITATPGLPAPSPRPRRTLTSTPEPISRQPLRSTGVDPHPAFAACSRRHRPISERSPWPPGPHRPRRVGQRTPTMVPSPIRLTMCPAGVPAVGASIARANSPQELEGWRHHRACNDQGRKKPTRSVKTIVTSWFCRTSGHRLGHGLPHLERAETDLPRRRHRVRPAGGPVARAAGRAGPPLGPAVDERGRPKSGSPGQESGAPRRTSAITPGL